MTGPPHMLAQRDQLWVLYKPAGFAVHQASDRSIPDLMTWASEHLPLPDAIAPINRLDRATSGVVLCSPDAKVRGEYGRMFAQNRVVKEYRALVFGRTHKKGVIRRPLKDKRRQKPLRCVTRYTRLASFRKTSYLAVTPETGRYHQIRRHMQGIGHALVGDERYPPSRFQPIAGFPGRLWLHAHSLTLPDGETFIAPLPPELDEHIALLEELEARSTG